MGKRKDSDSQGSNSHNISSIHNRRSSGTSSDMQISVNNNQMIQSPKTSNGCLNECFNEQNRSFEMNKGPFGHFDFTNPDLGGF